MELLPSSPDQPPLHSQLVALGHRLRETLLAVVHQLPDSAQKTAGLSRFSGTNKVFTSRLLTALRQEDPLSVVHRLPGPDPLRRFLESEGVQKAAPTTVGPAQDAIGRFQKLIETEAGDRASLQTLMSTWLGDARSEFDLRRRQSAFKAISELKGSSVDLNLSVAVLHPSQTDGYMDLVWLMGMIGLQRLRHGAQVRLDTQRLTDEGTERHPASLRGAPMDGNLDADLDAFCPHGPAPLEARQVGGTMNYLLAGDHFGPHRRSDMLLVEVNRAEMRRFRHDQPERRSFVYANPVPPTHLLVVDVFLHKSLMEGTPPELLVFDTAGSGPKDPNEPISTFDLMEISEQLEYHDCASGLPDLPEYLPYAQLLATVLGKMEWAMEEFHVWRVRMPYPLHSSQVTVAFRPRPE